MESPGVGQSDCVAVATWDGTEEAPDGMVRADDACSATDAKRGRTRGLRNATRSAAAEAARTL